MFDNLMDLVGDVQLLFRTNKKLTIKHKKTESEFFDAQRKSFKSETELKFFLSDFHKKNDYNYLSKENLNIRSYQPK